MRLPPGSDVNDASRLMKLSFWRRLFASKVLRDGRSPRLVCTDARGGAVRFLASRSPEFICVGSYRARTVHYRLAQSLEAGLKNL
jgi:hypothetical protein